jgi:predicted ArsR family transcriptional regulator
LVKLSKIWYGGGSDWKGWIGDTLGSEVFRSTRGRIITLLRRSRCTVEELARELGFTDNGVRVHLATLDRDGIVRQRGSVRRGSGRGKLAYVYQLTPKAEGLFPKAYEPVLCRLLDVLSERLGPEKPEAVLRSVGHRIAEEQGVSVVAYVRGLRRPLARSTSWAVWRSSKRATDTS